MLATRRSHEEEKSRKETFIWPHALIELNQPKVSVLGVLSSKPLFCSVNVTEKQFAISPSSQMLIETSLLRSPVARVNESLMLARMIYSISNSPID
jgi:hypothetical protein